MVIYEYSKCMDCGKEYKGRFVVKDKGKVVCEDCDNIEEIGKVNYREVDESKELKSDIVRDLLTKDLNRIYITTVEEGKDELHDLRDKEGLLDQKKVYYQNNEIGLIVDLHRGAYKALTYIEMGEDQEYIDTAKEIYDKYIQSRYTKYSKEEEDEIKKLLKTKEMIMIEQQVSI